MSLNEPLLLAPRAERAAELPSLGEALSIAFESRPDLKAAKLAEQEAEAKIKLAESAGAPDFSAILGFKRTSTVNPAPVHSSDWQFKVGVSVTVPVTGRNQGLIRESAALLAEARLHRENLEQLIRRDVMVAARRFERAQRELKITDEALRLARDSVQMARLGFEQGELRLVDYITEQRRLTDLEDAYAQARNEFFQARAEFWRALGK
jgi:outer membrane protein TolC